MTSSAQSYGQALWRDVRLALAAFGAATVVIVAIGMATAYVTGVFFLVAIAWLAWYAGFRAGLVVTLLSAVALWPLILLFDPQATGGNPLVRSLSVVAVGLVVSWLVGNLHTARHRLLDEQARLRDSEQFHRLIGEMTSDFAFRARVDDRQRFVLDAASSGLQSMLGYSAADLPTISWRNVFDPADLDTVKADLARVLSGEDVQGSARVHGRDGQRAIVEYRLHPTRDAEGAVAGVIGAARDVTADRAHATALADERRRFMVATDAVFGVIYEWDVPSGRVQRFGGIEALTGYSFGESEPTADWWTALMPADDLVRVGAEWNAAVAGRLPQHESIYRLRHRNGALVHVWERSQLVFDDRGQVVRKIGCMVDITERLATEDALHRSKNEAERRAHDAEEARAALKDRERRLEGDARLKDEFLATLAHELRNPLAPLRNVPSVLRSHGLPAAAEPAVAVLERQVAQMIRLVDDLLDTSRITRGHPELRRQPVALQDVLTAVVDAARSVLDAAGVTCTVAMPAVPVVLDADAMRLSQIFSNLLSNAAKFTPAGGQVTVAVTTLPHLVEVSVKDTGIGIPADEQDRVFELFVQLGRASRRSQTGLGIGLTLARQMAELHGGSVSVWSAGAGRGTEFVVSLPCLHTAAVEAAPHVVPEVAPLRRILVVDDSHDGADSLALLLGFKGHAVEVAYDGRSGLAKAETFRPDVVLTDIGMPEFSGYDVARALRRTPWGRTLTLIALTGWGQPDDRRRSDEAGFDHHLVKPIAVDDIEQLLAASVT